MKDFTLLDQFLAPESDEASTEPVELGRNFKAVARGIAGHDKEVAERRRVASKALELQAQHPILSDAGAFLLAEKGRAVT